MTIFIDADACPVKDETLRVADRHKISVTMVSNTWMRRSEHPLVTMVTVPEGPDTADDWIAERAAKGDIVITADIPLAARCVENGARVLRPNGKPLTEDAVGMALAMRNLSTHLRETGDFTGGPAPFTKRDRSRFLDTLEATVQAVKRGK